MCAHIKTKDSRHKPDLLTFGSRSSKTPKETKQKRSLTVIDLWFHLTLPTNVQQQQKRNQQEQQQQQKQQQEQTQYAKILKNYKFTVC